MFVMVLDPRKTHGDNQDCPMRLTVSPDGRRWMCADCGLDIMWTRVDTNDIRTMRLGEEYVGIEGVGTVNMEAVRQLDIYKTQCSQCGKAFEEEACGPTHALIAHEKAVQGIGDRLVEQGAVRKACHGRPPIRMPPTKEELAEEARQWDEGELKPTDPGWEDAPEAVPNRVPDGKEGNRG